MIDAVAAHGSAKGVVPVVGFATTHGIHIFTQKNGQLKLPVLLDQ